MRFVSAGIVAITICTPYVAMSALGTESTRVDTPVWLTCAVGGLTRSPNSDPNVFPASATHQKGGAENGNGPSDVALRAFLARGIPLPVPLPAHSYVLLRATPTTALYGHVAHPSVVDGYIMMVERADGWQYSNNGGCQPARVFAGRVTAAFDLGEQPRATSRTILLWIHAGTCTIDRPLGRAIANVGAAWRPHALVLTFLLRPKATTQTAPPGGPPLLPFCGGTALQIPVKVTLPRMLGHRRVFNGAFYPPARAKIGPIVPTRERVLAVGLH